MLATVKGDVHDIGKNLVDIILTNNGYMVYNLGIKIAITEMIDKALEVERRRDRHERPAREVDDHHAREPRGAEHARSRRSRAGAARRRRAHAQLRRSATCATSTTAACSTARTRSKACARWTRSWPASARATSIPRSAARPAAASCRRARASSTRPRRRSRSPTAPTSRSTRTIFTPPFVGSRVAKGISLDDIAGYINETALFRNQWQFRPEKGGDENDEEFKARIRPTLREQLGVAKQESLLVPAAAWGYFAVNAEGNDLVVWKDDTRTQEWLRFSFPRQRKAPFLCIADFFRPVESGEPDYAAFHVVTMGTRASEREKELFAADRYQEYLLLHGLSVEMTEALAELWHRRIREEWGFADEDGPSLAGLFRQQYRGSRYSWGYPACPDLDDQVKVAELLEIDRIGVAITEEFHLVPEQSTSAIVVPHPEAKYFVA